MSKLTIADLLSALPPSSEIQHMADLLLARGHTQADVIDQLVATLDELIDWHSIVRGIPGTALEAADGPLLRGFVRMVVSHVGKRRSQPTHT